jgi:hypothetical protein
MAKKISIGNMSSAIMEALEEYKEVTDEIVKNAVDTVSKEAKDIAKTGSPERYGGYKKGWTVKKTIDKSSQVSVTVHNRAKPGLTHLLEKGHAKRGGGRVEGITHIAPAEEYAIEELEAEIRKGLK